MPEKICVYFCDINGNDAVGMVVNIKIYNITDNIFIGEYVMTNVSGGLYMYNFSNYDRTKEYFFVARVVDKKNYRLLYNVVYNDSNDIKLDYIYNVECGDWKLLKDTKQMVFYDLNGNELLKFDLFDVNGRRTISSVGYRKGV